MNAQRSAEAPEVVKVFVSVLLGALIGSVVCDVTAISIDIPHLHGLIAFYTMAGGFFGGLVSVTPGVLHLLSRADEHFRGPPSSGLWSDLLILTLYASYIRMRSAHDSTTGQTQLMSVTAIVLLGLSRWLKQIRRARAFTRSN